MTAGRVGAYIKSVFTSFPRYSVTFKKTAEKFGKRAEPPPFARDNVWYAKVAHARTFVLPEKVFAHGILYIYILFEKTDKLSIIIFSLRTNYTFIRFVVYNNTFSSPKNVAFPMWPKKLFRRSRFSYPHGAKYGPELLKRTK